MTQDHRSTDDRDRDDGEGRENGRYEDGERVVVRDRRRVDPVTGEVRHPDPAAGTTPAAEVPSDEVPAADPLDELTAELAERTTDLQRVSAEYANYRRRVDRDREAVLVGARVQFVSEMLTVLDDLDRAQAHGDLAGPFKAVADKIVAVVQKQGLEAFGLAGEAFDPALHEAVQHEPAEVQGPAVTVVSAVLRSGYRIADRVLRPAMVTVVDRVVDPADGTDRADGADGAAGAEPGAEPPVDPS